MKVLIDNGHGKDTPGKRSPDGKLLEYSYTREIADRVVNKLKCNSIDAERIVPEENDISLKERCDRVNKIYKENNKQAILISIHCNAAGSGADWMNARGWSVFVDPSASNNSKKLATLMAEEAVKAGVKVRFQSNNVKYWTSSLYICKHTLCPAVLVENFFQDNKEDVEFLLSEEGKETVTNIMVNGILDYLKSI